MTRMLLPLAVFVLLACCAVLFACRSSKKAETPPATAVSEEGGDVAPVDPAAAEAERQQLVQQTITRVATIQNEVADLRGLPLKSPVPAAYQSQAEFRDYVKREIDRELPPEKNTNISRAIHHIGLSPEKIDLARTIEDAFVSQAGAYYDPESKKFYFVMVTKNQTILDTIAAHELVHAIQDQHFNLSTFVQEEASRTLNEDEISARRFVVEGEASMLMIVYISKATAGMDLLAEDNRRIMRGSLEMMASLSLDQAAEAQKQQSAAFEDLGEDFEKAIAAMEKIPPYILIPLLDAYGRGAQTVFEAYAHGGWDAVSALYTEPPQSTEQVLHPRTKLLGKRDYPVALTLPKPAALRGWTEIHSEVFGELTWRAYFETWKVGSAHGAAAGWDGDRYAVFAKGEATAAIMATTWDSDNDAEEFEASFIASLGARFPAAAPTKDGAITRFTRPEGTEVLIERRGVDVHVVDGAPAGQGAAILKELHGTQKVRHPKDV